MNQAPGMLLPVLNRALASAYAAACANSLNQMSKAGLLYTDDWDGVLPHRGSTSEISYSFWWLSTTDPKKKLKAYVPDSVFHCQTARSRISHPAYVSTWRKTGYELTTNPYLGGRSDGFPKPGGRPTSRLLTSKAFWFADGKLCGQGFFSMELYPRNIYNNPTSDSVPWMWSQSPATIDYVYAKGHGADGLKAQFVYGDGHTDALTPTDLMSRYPTQTEADKSFCGK